MLFTDCDLHIHTNLSLCARPSADPLLYVQAAREQGMKLIGFADHYWDEAVPDPNGFYAPQDTAHVLQLLDRWEELKEAAGEMKLLFGCECEYAHGDLGITEEKIALFDYLLIPHSHTHMKGFVLPDDCDTPKKHADYLVKSFLEVANHPLAKHITAIVHPFIPCGLYGKEAAEILSHISDETFAACAAAAKKADIALELNASCFATMDYGYYLEYKRFLEACKAAGCAFCAGSDKHEVVFGNSASSYAPLQRVAEELGLENKLDFDKLWENRKVR